MCLHTTFFLVQYVVNKILFKAKKVHNYTPLELIPKYAMLDFGHILFKF